MEPLFCALLLLLRPPEIDVLGFLGRLREDDDFVRQRCDAENVASGDRLSYLQLTLVLTFRANLMNITLMNLLFPTPACRLQSSLLLSVGRS